MALPLLEFTPEELRATILEYKERFVMPAARELARRKKRMKDEGVYRLPSATPTITSIARAIYNSRTTAKEWHVTKHTFDLIKAEGSVMSLYDNGQPVIIHGVRIKVIGAD